MAVFPPYPDLNALVKLMGEAGEHLAGIGASEGAAGHFLADIAFFPPQPPGTGDRISTILVRRRNV